MKFPRIFDVAHKLEVSQWLSQSWRSEHTIKAKRIHVKIVGRQGLCRALFGLLMLPLKILAGTFRPHRVPVLLVCLKAPYVCPSVDTHSVLAEGISVKKREMR